MKIFCRGGNATTDEMTQTFRRAACLCLDKENLPEDSAEISVSFVTEDEIHRLNKTYRDVDKSTDVLSFPLIDDFNAIRNEEELLLGDVVICREQAERQAAEYGHSVEREIVYLFVHSVLHLLGYDHMDAAGKREMRAREEEVMTALGLERE